MQTATMNPNHEIKFDGGQIGFRLRRSHRRTLAITVQPDLSVVVTAPHKAAVETVPAKVKKRAGWIRKQQRFWRVFAANAASPVCERRDAPLPRAAIPADGRRGDGCRCGIEGDAAALEHIEPSFMCAFPKDNRRTRCA